MIIIAFFILLLHQLINILVLHELKLIHTDLKPENILLVDSTSLESAQCGNVCLKKEKKKQFRHINHLLSW
jgi:serine/threonine protein kinase